ncbi:7TM diverse intracellular signaling domain-containing protein [uncultured Microscilla sp.]|uniref:7TM diverse intracellular signaling domain-containing protein n=1 Tax=uncultured Microscilla sp. TaxID=432653 RepID=UPI0026301681|nr:7TM diverse intracellular signaling domain-containing protein [uncultured Microscilla sp.]
MKITALLISFLCFCHFTAAQNTIFVKDKRKLLLGSKNVQFLEDESGKLTLQDILTPSNQQKFEQNHKGVVRYNTPVVWFKITVQNRLDEDVWLEIGDSFGVWYADFYAPLPGDSSLKYASPKLLGALRSNKSKASAFGNYCIRIVRANDTATKVLYLRVLGKFPHVHSFHVGSVYAFSRYFRMFDYLVAGFVILILSMVVYNSFIWYATKDKVYVYYILALLGIMFNITFDSGYSLFSHRFFWDYFFVWHGIAFYFIYLFAVHYLDLQQAAPKVRFWLLLLMLILVVIFPCLNLLPLSNFTSLLIPYQLFIILFYFSLLVCGIYLWFKGYKKARFYTLGWGFAITGVFIFIASVNNIIPINVFTQQIMYVGFGVEALIFGLALGDRLNSLKKEKEFAQATNLALVREQKEVLEQKVEERTREIQNQKEELETQAEELSEIHSALRKAYRDIHEKNEHLNASIDYAQTIQSAALSLDKKVVNMLGEDNFFIFFNPLEKVSGDFYYFQQVGEKLVVAAVDCTGHGVPGALMSMIGIEVMNEIIRTEQVTAPDVILTKLHTHIWNTLKQEDTNNRDGMDIALVTIDKTNKKLCYAGAKNHLVYYQNKQIEHIKASRYSVGGNQIGEGQTNNGSVFISHEISLEQPTTFYLFSDGLQDQFGGRNDKKFTPGRLRELLKEVQPLSLAKQKETIAQTIKDWQGDKAQVDDMLLIGIKVDISK